MFLREHNRKTNSKYYAHSFCIRQCTVGETLKSMGNSCHEKHPENSLDVFSVLLRLVDAHIYLIFSSFIKMAHLNQLQQIS